MLDELLCFALSKWQLRYWGTCFCFGWRTVEQVFLPDLGDFFVADFDEQRFALSQSVSPAVVVI
jgi:hypothetical protein